MSFVSEQEVGTPLDDSVDPSLRTTHPAERFVISPGSSVFASTFDDQFDILSVSCPTLFEKEG